MAGHCGEDTAAGTTDFDFVNLNILMLVDTGDATSQETADRFRC